MPANGLSKIRERIARKLSPDLMDLDQVQKMVQAEVRLARQALPVNLDYDPDNQGYRRLSGDGQTEQRRNLTPVSQETMLEMAYYLYDSSGLVKRFVRDTKNFILGEGINLACKNDEAGQCMAVLKEFWNHPMNQMNIRLEKRVEFFGLLGEQCWPVKVNPYNGQVYMTYVDPVNISEVITVREFPELIAAVDLKGSYGRDGKRLTAIRPELDPRKREYDRLVGDCFFFSANNPPNGPRGRSDLIHLFDFINGFEEGLFDELDRVKGIKAFIWDVTLKGATKEEIQDFLRDNKAPQSNSVRAHNEQVEWNAVAPDLKSQDNKALYEMMKTYLSACMNRPDSWLGSGGKAYQNEADLMGEPTFKDLGSRQRYVKYMLEQVLRFVKDQAVLHGRLRENLKKPFVPKVDMPEMSAKDTKQVVDGLFTLAQSLALATSNGWISDETATKLYASAASQIGVEIDAAEEIKKAAESAEVPKEYQAREALLSDLTNQVTMGMNKQKTKT